jgi:hypothetical protein
MRETVLLTCWAASCGGKDGRFLPERGPGRDTNSVPAWASRQLKRSNLSSGKAELNESIGASLIRSTMFLRSYRLCKIGCRVRRIADHGFRLSGACVYRPELLVRLLQLLAGKAVRLKARRTCQCLRRPRVINVSPGRREQRPQGRAPHRRQDILWTTAPDTPLKCAGPIILVSLLCCCRG